MIVVRPFDHLGIVLADVTNDYARLSDALGPAFLAENSNAPSKWRLDRRAQRAGNAIFELDQCRSCVARRQLEGPRFRKCTDPFHRADQIAEAVEHVNPHTGHSAGAAFL